jgi:hypothetical protein
MYPNYSDEFIVRETYTLEAGELSIPRDLFAQARRYLNTALPAWVDWRLRQRSATTQYFIVGGKSKGSVLDRTPLR